MNDINTQIAGSALSGLIKAKSSGNQIQLVADQTGISLIKFQDNPGTAYDELFLGVTYSSRYYYNSDRGETTKPQGTTAYTETPATLTLSYAVKSEPIVVDSTNNIFRFSLRDGSKSVSLTEGTYTASSLVSELNRKFADGGFGLTASLSGGKITFTTTEKGENSYLHIESNNNPAMMVLMEPRKTTSYPSVKELSPAYILGKTQITSSQPVTIDTSNNILNLSYQEGNTKNNATLTVKQGTYSSASALANELNAQLQNSALKGLVSVETTADGYIKLVTEKKGSNVFFTTVSGGFYDNVLCRVDTLTSSNEPFETKGTTSLQEEAFVVGRADLNNSTVEIKKGVNDVLSIDLTCPDATGKSQVITLETKIPAGIYTGDKIAQLLTEGKMDTDGMDSFNELLKKEGITGVTITAKIGGINTGVVGANDANALNFSLKRGDTNVPLNSGTYILDGVSGSAAYSVFYKTSGLPMPAYVIGTKDISDGVVITPDNNTIGFSVDGQKYEYTIPTGEYTAEQWVAKINELIDAGDNEGNIAKVETVLEDGKWKIQYKGYGAHIISDVVGTGKQDVFYGISKGQEDMQLRVQVGANGGQELALNKLALNISLLKLDGVDVTKHTLAKFALKHMDYAINFINSKRSDYGAKQNRLEAVERLVENMGENLQSAESGVRDADMADEAMQYAKNNIIIQAGQSVLAQANQLAQGVTVLLQ